MLFSALVVPPPYTPILLKSRPWFFSSFPDEERKTIKIARFYAMLNHIHLTDALLEPKGEKKQRVKNPRLSTNFRFDLLLFRIKRWRVHQTLHSERKLSSIVDVRRGYSLESSSLLLSLPPGFHRQLVKGRLSISRTRVFFASLHVVGNDGARESQRGGWEDEQSRGERPRKGLLTGRMSPVTQPGLSCLLKIFFRE